MPNIEVVRFQGDVIQAIRQGNEVWVVVRRVCDALGIAEQRQATKLREKHWATTTLMVAVAEDGKNRELFCVSLDSLPMWLATIEASRVNPESRPKLIAYQRECARVLRDHFFGKLQATADGMVSISMVGQIIEPLLERQNQHFLLLMRSMDDRNEQRFSRLERGYTGTISPQTHARIQALVRKIAMKEVLIKRAPNVRSAMRALYNDIGELTGWGGKQQKWCDLPAHCESPVIVFLSRRLVDAERHADRLLARQMEMFPKVSEPN